MLCYAAATRRAAAGRTAGRRWRSPERRAQHLTCVAGVTNASAAMSQCATHIRPALQGHGNWAFMSESDKKGPGRPPVVHGDGFHYPGPGCYSPSLDSPPPGSGSSPSSSFRPPHFKGTHTKASTPGPGQYSTQRPFATTGPGVPSAPSSGFSWSRLPTAPSIPPPSSTLNLDEADASQVRHDARAPVGPEPGPGSYSPQHVLTQHRASAPDFGAGTGREQRVQGVPDALPKDGPAPGMYHEVTENPRPLCPPPSQVFSSRSQRHEAVQKDAPDCPSPLDYNPPPGMGSVKPVPRHVPVQRKHCVLRAAAPPARDGRPPAVTGGGFPY